MVDGFLALGASFFLSPQHRLRKLVNSSFNCGAVYQPPKKSSAQALETASVPLPTKLTSSVQMMFLGLIQRIVSEMLTKQPASYRPSSLSTSDTILFVMRDKKRGQGKTQSIGGLSPVAPPQPTRGLRVGLLTSARPYEDRRASALAEQDP